MKCFVLAITAFAAAALSAPMNMTMMAQTPKSQVLTVFSDTGSAQVTLPVKALGGNTMSLMSISVMNPLESVGKDVNNWIGGMHAGDIAKRQEFTKRVVANARQLFPNTNIVMSNVKYTFNGDLILQGKTSCNIKLGTSVSYDILLFNKGTFVLQGDGGFENWAYIVNSSCKRNGGTITC